MIERMSAAEYRVMVDGGASSHAVAEDRAQPDAKTGPICQPDFVEYFLTMKPFSLNNAYQNLPQRRVKNKIIPGGRVKTKEYKAWVKAAERELSAQLEHRLFGTYKLFIRVGRKLSRADADNLIKPISDVLVNIGATPDDGKAIGFDIEYEDRSDTLIRVINREKQGQLI